MNVSGKNSFLWPLPFCDKRGKAFFISKADVNFFEALCVMYSCFNPRPGLQGLPPYEDVECRSWIKGLLDKGINLVAMREEGEIVGHCALLPGNNDKEAEYMIFVHQDNRNIGIGTSLTQTAKEVAKKEGIQMLWLCVSSINIPAIKLYLKTGFSFKVKAREECLMQLRL